MNIFTSILLLVLSILTIASCFQISDRITSDKVTKYDDLKIFETLRWIFLSVILVAMFILGVMAYLKKLTLTPDLTKFVSCFMLLIIVCNVLCFTIPGIINDSSLTDLEKISKLNGLVFFCSSISSMAMGFIISQISRPAILATMTLFSLILWSGFNSNLSMEQSKCSLTFMKQSLLGSILSGLVIGYSFGSLVTGVSSSRTSFL